MKIIIQYLLFFSTIVTASAAENATLSVTSFNIKLYGQKTQLQPDAMAPDRDRALINFIKNEIPESDVYVFEEIMNKHDFIKNVVKDLNCVSYDNPRAEHQYILICAKEQYQLKIDTQVDDNFALEEVALGSTGQRPAVHALVTNSLGQPLARVIGVHLNAFPANTANRLKQTEIIRKHLMKADSNVPTIITGDFNTYPASLTGQPRSDIELISEVLRKDNMKINMPSHPAPYTFRSPEFRSKFDHFWKSESLQSVGPVHVTGYCNERDEEDSFDLFSIPDYYDLISDHCPVTLKVKLPIR